MSAEVEGIVVRLLTKIAGPVAVVATLIASLGLASPACAADTHALIQGSGSTWASHAVNQYVADVERLGLVVAYNPDGTAAGKQDFADRVADFAVTDVPYLGLNEATGVSDTSNGREYGDIPIAAGGTAFPYHLTVKGKQVRNLRFSGLTLAKIFTGRITNWDSPAITADNNGVRLPSLAIKPVVHSEGAGVTYEFSTYLADEYPSLWEAFAFTSLPTQYWPRSGIRSRRTAATPS